MGTRTRSLGAIACSLGTVLMTLQPADAKRQQELPSVSVTSVRRVQDPSARTATFVVTPGRVSATNITIAGLLVRAFSTPLTRIAGMPDWYSREYFDLEIRTTGEVSGDTLPGVLRRLLVDRFNLETHVEQREMPIYALRIARDDGRLGPDLRYSRNDCAAFVEAQQKWDLSHQGERPRSPDCESRTRVDLGVATMDFPDITMEVLAKLLESWTGRVVRDDTRLSGTFDVTLGVAAADVPILRAYQIGDASASDGSALFTALREQLGLQLQPTRGHVDVVVIDAVTLPTPN